MRIVESLLRHQSPKIRKLTAAVQVLSAQHAAAVASFTGGYIINPYRKWEQVVAGARKESHVE